MPSAVHHHNLAGFHVAHKLCAYGVQRAGFRRKYVAVLRFAHAQGAEAVNIARGDQLGGADQCQRKCAFQLIHGRQHRLFNAADFQALLCDGVGNHLGIAGGVEDRAAHLLLLAQLVSVDNVAVVRQGHAAL